MARSAEIPAEAFGMLPGDGLTEIDVGREVAGGASLSSVSGLVWTELGVGVYAAIAFSLVRWFEFEGRRRASLETF